MFAATLAILIGSALLEGGVQSVAVGHPDWPERPDVAVGLPRKLLDTCAD